MNTCPKCGSLNLDDVKSCAKCGSAMGAAATPRTVKLERAPRVDGAASGAPAASAAAGGDSADIRRELEKDGRVLLEGELEREREKRGRAEQEVERLKREAAERSGVAARLQAQINFLKDIGKIVVAAAAGVFLVMLIIAVMGFSREARKAKELAEYRPYRSLYDSVHVLSRKIRSERDSLRLALTELEERYAKLSSHHKAPAAARSAAPAHKVNIDIDMVPVKGGEFTMGCTAEQGGDCEESERPAHKVAVSGFSIGKYPVTQGLWKQVMEANPSQYRGDDRPVEQVSWRDAQEFIKRLNTMTGKRYRLPTEAEWEYAARGGASSRGFKYAGSNRVEEVAWYGRSSGTHPVGTKHPNELGIYDMSGNVREWVGDIYGRYGETNPPGTERVLRGGSWTNTAKSCRVSDRTAYASGARSNHIGFRLATSQ